VRRSMVEARDKRLSQEGIRVRGRKETDLEKTNRDSTCFKE
jgi:hypothetical protein